jgi:hypothetical protein
MADGGGDPRRHLLEGLAEEATQIIRSSSASSSFRKETRETLLSNNCIVPVMPKALPILATCESIKVGVESAISKFEIRQNYFAL